MEQDGLLPSTPVESSCPSGQQQKRFRADEPDHRSKRLRHTDLSTPQDVVEFIVAACGMDDTEQARLAKLVHEAR